MSAVAAESTIRVNVSGLSGTIELELPAGATVGDAREAAGINDGLSVRADGQSVSNDAPLRDEQVLVTTAPEAKHGILG